VCRTASPARGSQVGQRGHHDGGYLREQQIFVHAGDPSGLPVDYMNVTVNSV
jgi:hypothetical protein